MSLDKPKLVYSIIIEVVVLASEILIKYLELKILANMTVHSDYFHALFLSPHFDIQ